MKEKHDEQWETFLDEFVKIFTFRSLLKHKVFICGSYLLENFKKLKFIKTKINNNEDYIGVFESDFTRTHEENLILKFKLLAKFAQKIIIIVEHDKGGHMIEIGIILATRDLFDKTIIFSLEKAPITLMLVKGGYLKPFFQENKNLFYFSDIESLSSLVSRMFPKKPGKCPSCGYKLGDLRVCPYCGVTYHDDGSWR